MERWEECDFFPFVLFGSPSRTFLSSIVPLYSVYTYPPQRKCACERKRRKSKRYGRGGAVAVPATIWGRGSWQDPNKTKVKKSGTLPLQYCVLLINAYLNFLFWVPTHFFFNLRTQLSPLSYLKRQRKLVPWETKANLNTDSTFLFDLWRQDWRILSF